jgi:hypothetical protein
MQFKTLLLSTILVVGIFSTSNIMGSDDNGELSDYDVSYKQEYEEDLQETNEFLDFLCVKLEEDLLIDGINGLEEIIKKTQNLLAFNCIERLNDLGNEVKEELIDIYS